MNKIFVTSVITFVISLGQILGQTTTTTSQSQNQDGKIETYTRIETVQHDGRTITTTTHTSTPNADASFGIKANANISNFVIRDNDYLRSNSGFGFSAGIFMKAETGNYAFQLELLLHHKTSEIENETDQTKADYTFWGLEIPMYHMGQINTRAGKIFIGAGPYASLGLDAVQNPGNFDLYNKNNNGKSTMQRWDVGISAIAGYEFNCGIIISVIYQVGLINMMSAEKNNMALKSRTVNFGIGYKF